jgi:ATP-dependent DNA helicase RecQ
MMTLQLYQQGLSVLDIAETRGLKESTIYGHLSELIELNQPININDFVTLEKQKAIIQTMQTVTEGTLSALKEALGENYTYNEIRLVTAWQRRTKNQF